MGRDGGARGARPGVDGSRKRESILDNGEEDAPPSNQTGPYDQDTRPQVGQYTPGASPQEVIDAEWSAAGRGTGLESWPLEDLEEDRETDFSERRARADMAGPSMGRLRDTGATGWQGDPFWGSPEELGTPGSVSAGPPEGVSEEDWQRVQAEIESDWGPSTWQATGMTCGRWQPRKEGKDVLIGPPPSPQLLCSCVLPVGCMRV